MLAAQAVVKILEAEGIKNAFGIPGAGINPVYKYLGQSDISHFTMRHEEACVHAADGHYRSSGEMALAICTSGPGATNFVTGLYTADIDSIPLIAITGQNVTSLLGKDAFQCVDIADIARTVCKKAWCVTDAKELPEIMREAFKVAKSGKPGPVLIDLPLDVQKSDIDFDIADYAPLETAAPTVDMDKISEALELIKSAKNPVIVMGGGVVLSGATKECIELAECMQIPVIPTYMAKGAIPDEHPLNAGHMGIQVGGPMGNKTFLESDVVLGIGCRFTDRHTGALPAYVGERKFIHINIEPREIGKLITPEVGIVADAKEAINAMLTAANKEKSCYSPAERVKNLPAEREGLRRKTDFNTKPIKPQKIFNEINKEFDDDTIFTTGCGLVQIWSGQFQKINKPMRYLPSGGAGTLGFDIPAAIGAVVGDKLKNKGVCVMGDFGFTFMVEELAVAAKHKLPIIVVILNNAYLSLIRQNQKYAYEYECAVAMEENQNGLIDYVKVAEGFGCKAERVTEPQDIAAALQRAKASDMPYVIDIVCEKETDGSMGNSIDAVKEHE
jgi:tartronate-semialdehyde synthase